MIEMVITSLFFYLFLGVVFAIVFSVFGLRRVDPATTNSTLGFRLICLPGCVLLWPMMLAKWVRA